MTGPFGEHLPNQITQPPNTLAPTQAPLNTTSGTSWHYVGQHQKMTDLESSAIIGGITQMGARVYLPILGRFLQVDPVEGGTDNSYVYANDPVNEFDLDGKWIRDAWDNTKKAARSAAKWVWKHKADIALTAAAFVPGVGSVAVAARVVRSIHVAYRVARAARLGRDLRSFGVVGRRTSNLAGRIYTGRYFTPLRKNLVSRDGLRMYRAPIYKPRIGIRQSNFMSRTSRNRSFYNKNNWGYYNGHLRVR